MKTFRMLRSSLLAFFIAGSALVEAAETVQYRPKPREGRMSIEGTSNVHDWLIEGMIIGGNVQAGPEFKSDPKLIQPGKLDLKVDAMIPVRSLKSVKDGKPYDAKMDEAMYEEMKMADNPQVRYSSSQLTVKETPQSPDGAFLLETEGDLTIAGTTRKISMPIEMKLPDEKTIEFAGKMTILMTDYGVGPVARLGGLFKTGDEVKLDFRWVVGKR